MKHGLILPNGRNATGMNADDIHFAKTGEHKLNAMFAKNNAGFEKMLDIWKQSGHNHTVGQEIVLKIRGN